MPTASNTQTTAPCTSPAATCSLATSCQICSVSSALTALPHLMPNPHTRPQTHPGPRVGNKQTSFPSIPQPAPHPVMSSHMSHRHRHRCKQSVTCENSKYDCCIPSMHIPLQSPRRRLPTASVATHFANTDQGAAQPAIMSTPYSAFSTLNVTAA